MKMTIRIVGSGLRYVAKAGRIDDAEVVEGKVVGGIVGDFMAVMRNGVVGFEKKETADSILRIRESLCASEVIGTEWTIEM
jgi:hypothetical protein